MEACAGFAAPRRRGTANRDWTGLEGRPDAEVRRRPDIAGTDYTADHPPSTDSVAPVMFAASSLARNTTAAATSESVLARRDGTRASSGARYSANSALRSVMLGPGATVLTRTPRGPYSSAHDLVNEWIAALVALYRAEPPMPISPLMDPMLMIDPAPWSAIAGAITPVSRNGAETLTANASRTSCSGTSAVGL